MGISLLNPAMTANSEWLKFGRIRKYLKKKSKPRTINKKNHSLIYSPNAKRLKTKADIVLHEPFGDSDKDDFKGGDLKMASDNSNRNLVAALSYLLGFITGVVILLVEKDDKFIRFHAMQSSVVSGALFIVSLVLGFILAPIGILATLVNIIISIAGIVVWIVSMVKAYQGQLYNGLLPVIFPKSRLVDRNRK